MAWPAVKARTPTSAPGSSLPARPRWRAAAAGFTLIELLLVLLIIVMVSGLASLALRDSAEASLDRETLRLAALLEAGRAEARAGALAVRFELVGVADRAAGEADFRFVGLPPESSLPRRWLDREVLARIDGARALRLGPEPLIGAQRIVLSLGQRQRVLATDGLAPFAMAEPTASP